VEELDKNSEKITELVKPICDELKAYGGRSIYARYWDDAVKDGVLLREPIVCLSYSWYKSLNTVLIEFNGSPPRFPIYLSDIQTYPQTLIVNRARVRSEMKVEKVKTIVLKWIIKYNYCKKPKYGIESIMI